MQWNQSILTRTMLAKLQRRAAGNVFQCVENVVNILQPITSSHIGMPLSPALYHCINTATRHFISFHSCSTAFIDFSVQISIFGAFVSIFQ